MSALLLLLLLPAPSRAQRDAREADYYNWCRSQGGTPEGTLSTLHCVPPSGDSGGSGGSEAAASPAGQFVQQFTTQFTNALQPNPEGFGRRAANAAANSRAMQQQQSAQGLEAEGRFLSAAERERAEEEARRRMSASSLILGTPPRRRHAALADETPDLKRIMREQELRQKALEKMKGKKDELWCKLHLPEANRKPVQLSMDDVDAHRANLDRWRANKRRWDERCGGPLDMDDEDDAAAGAIKPKASKAVETKVVRPAGAGAKPGAGGAVDAKPADSSDDDKNAPPWLAARRARKSENGEVRAATAEDVHDVGSSGFDDRGAVKKKAEDGFVAPPDDVGHRVVGDNDAPSGASREQAKKTRTSAAGARSAEADGRQAPRVDPHPAQGEARGGPIGSGESSGRGDRGSALQTSANEDMKYLFPEASNPALQVSKNEDMRYLFPDGGSAWPADTRRNPYLDPKVAQKLDDERLRDMHQRLVAEFEGKAPMSEEDLLENRMIRDELTGKPASWDPELNAIARKSREAANRAEEQARDRMHVELLDLYQDLSKRGVLARGEPMERQMRSSPRLRAELEKRRVPILQRYEAAVIASEARMDAEIDLACKRRRRNCAR